MKYSKLIFRNIFRNKLRALMTLLLLAAIFFLVATLLAINAAFERNDTGGTGDRLVTQSAFSLANMLPFAYEEKIRRVPGVVDTAKTQWIGGYYKDTRNNVALMAIDPNKVESVFPDYKVPPAELAAFIADRTGAIVSEALATRWGWKIGDRITIKRQIFPFDPQLTVRAIHHHPVQKSAIWLQMPYFQESIGNFGRSDMIWLKVAKTDDMPRISQEIDALFRNSNDPTETYTEKEFTRQFVSMMGNVKVLFMSVSISSIAMIVLLAAITMSMSARERVTEVAVLKAIGFQPRLILTLMLTEFASLTLLGGLIGIGGAVLFYRSVDAGAATQGLLENFRIDPQTTTICVVLAALVGIIAGGLPSIRASRLTVVDGLRRVV
jgi:putative ABC transport system permease protein